jgi:LysR family transcriptional regulator for bpeEF and oprC
VDLLNAMRNFTAIVEAGSFSHAAVRLRISNATISQSIKNLEDHLGVRLLSRNTRHVKLTEEGMRYNERCRLLLAEIDDIELTLGRSKDEAVGRLCVEIPYALGKSYILPHLPDFTKAYPGIEMTVLLNPSSGRLIEDGIDVALQLGTLASSSLIARRVHSMRHLPCAAPSYVSQHGAPRHPLDLKAHQCIGFWSPNARRVADWPFERDNDLITHTPRGTVHFNSSEAAIELAREGAGIVYMPDLLVEEDLRAGRLVRLLDEWSTLERPLYLVYPDKRYRPTKVRAFSEFIEGIFEGLQARPAARGGPSRRATNNAQNATSFDVVT